LAKKKRSLLVAGSYKYIEADSINSD